MASDMSEQNIQLTYDGPGLVGHTMNVEQLAPALLAVATLCREANTLVNEDNTSVNVFVRSDFEHGCFQVSFEVIQTVLEAVTPLLQDGRIATAKEILEWLGILVGPPSASIGLIAYLRRRRARKVESAKRSGPHNVDVKFEGDSNTVTIHNNVYQMSDNSKILKALKQIVEPAESEGIETIEFSEADKSENKETISKEDAKYIIDTEVPEEEIEPQVIEARLRIFSPIFDTSSPKWRFRFGRQTITADISATNLALDVLRRRHINVDDSWKVQLEITERKTPAGNFINDYKILKILDYVPGDEQTQLSLEYREGIESDED